MLPNNREGATNQNGRKRSQNLNENHADLQKHGHLSSKTCRSEACKSYQNPPRPGMLGVKNQDSSDTVHGAKPIKANHFKDRLKIYVK